MRYRDAYLTAINLWFIKISERLNSSEANRFEPMLNGKYDIHIAHNLSLPF